MSMLCLRNRARGSGPGCTRHEFAALGPGQPGPDSGSELLPRTRFQGIACATKLTYKKTVRSLILRNRFLQIDLKLLNTLLYNFAACIHIEIVRF